MFWPREGAATWQLRQAWFLLIDVWELGAVMDMATPDAEWMLLELDALFLRCAHCIENEVVHGC